MRFGFVTCVQLGLSCMEAIYQVGGKLDLALTLPDGKAVNKSGRVYIDDFCAARGIPLCKISNINDEEAIQTLKAAQLDWLFIIGWSQIARQAVLTAPRRGVLGMHPTLLPTGRGRAAIPWAILKGLPQTGVTLFKLDDGIDTGDILAQSVIRLHSTTDASELYEAVDATHVALMKCAFPKLLNGTLRPREQLEADASEWPGRRPEDGEINLTGSVFDAERLVRAVTRPYPGAFYVNEGRKIVIWKARVANDSVGKHCLTFFDGTLECLDWEDAGPAQN